MMNPETLNLKFYSDFHLIAQAPLDRNINQLHTQLFVKL